MAVYFFLMLASPVMALEISDLLTGELDDKNVLVNELISLAGKAAREGDYEKATAYEDRLIALGVEIVVADTYEEASIAFEMLDNQTATQTSIEKPADTNSVHWYRCEYPRYYYPQKYKAFDAITLRAVSWDDTSNWLHLDKWSHKDSSTYIDTGYLTIAAAGARYVFDSFVANGATKLGLGISYTMLDFISQVVGTVDSTALNVSMDSYFCHYVADVSYIFTYVKETDTNDYYRLSGVEAIVDAQYQVHFTGHVKYADGHVDSYPESTVVISSTKISNDKIDIFKSFDAYELGVQYIGHIGEIYVNMDGKDYYITYINMPESPAAPFSVGKGESAE